MHFKGMELYLGIMERFALVAIMNIKRSCQRQFGSAMTHFSFRLVCLPSPRSIKKDHMERTEYKPACHPIHPHFQISRHSKINNYQKQVTNTKISPFHKLPSLTPLTKTQPQPKQPQPPTLPPPSNHHHQTLEPPHP